MSTDTDRMRAALMEAASVISYNDEQHRYHRIEPDGSLVRIPSVTTILGVIDKPALKWWSARVAVEHMRSVLAEDRAITEEDLDAARRAHQRIANDGASIGTIVHDTFAAWLTGAEPALPADDDEAMAAATAIDAWIDARQPEPVAVEQIVVESSRPLWAGRLDLVCRLPEYPDGLVVVDLKTNKTGAYPEHLLQNAAYAKCVQDATGEQVHATIVVHASRYGAGWSEVVRDVWDWPIDAAMFERAFALHHHMRELRAVTNPVTVKKPKDQEAA